MTKEKDRLKSYENNSQNTFSFIIHPIKLSDLNFPKFLRVIPDAISTQALKMVKPFMISNLIRARSTKGIEVTGRFVMCPLLPTQFKQMNTNFLVSKVLKSCRVAQKGYTKIIGLGGYTSIVCDKNIKMVEDISTAITTGNSLTVAMVIEGCLKVAKSKNIRFSTANIAIIGATGSIGSACSKLLAESKTNLILCAPRIARLEKLKKMLLKLNGSLRVTVETDARVAASNADIVIAASSASKALLSIEDFKKNAIVCDVAVPANVALGDRSKRPDVNYFKGGLVKPAAGIYLGLNIGLPSNVIYGCLAETIVLAFERRFENYSLGRELSIQKIKEIDKIATAHGFLPFTNYPFAN